MLTSRLALAALLATLTSACAPPDQVFDEELDDELVEDGKADGASGNVLYLNFVGGTFRGGNCDDARTNCSSLIPISPTQVSAFDSARFGGRESITRIAAGVRAAFAGLDLRVTTRRPASGSYHMIVVGGKALDVLGLWVLGRAGLGCGNANKNAIGFVTPFFDDRKAPSANILDAWHPIEVFHWTEQHSPQEWNESEAGIIRAIAHEAGHTYGLVHTAGFAASNPSPADMMCEEAACRNAGMFEFKRRTMSLDRSQGQCGAETQSSYELLRTNLR